MLKIKRMRFKEIRTLNKSVVKLRTFLRGDVVAFVLKFRYTHTHMIL